MFDRYFEGVPRPGFGLFIPSAGHASARSGETAKAKVLVSFGGAQYRLLRTRRHQGYTRC
jgi:hypothetical protein